jgi:hypothetical protein
MRDPSEEGRAVSRACDGRGYGSHQPFSASDALPAAAFPVMQYVAVSAITRKEP